MLLKSEQSPIAKREPDEAKMKQFKRNVIIWYCLTIAVATVYVPWQWDIYSTRTLDGGYGFLFSPPDDRFTINYGKLALEFLGITAVAGAVYLVSEKRAGK